ncbi:MAG: hypothetical protein DRO88_00130 [Promethearchaeia archaeon]|nr:MAG: hypothetical protein DRO88_00130 [Candidatus Lokiarchaeia archaeon]
MQAISFLSKKELLKRAKSFYFSLGVEDGASSLCRWNFQYGLAKIHYAQEQLGKDPLATFISTPDETISRNKIRWQNGYGYGGKLTWGDAHDPLIFIDTKPNACGMLVGGLDELPEPSEIIQNINKIIQKEVYIDDIKIQWDFKKGNHFIDVFEIEEKFNDSMRFPNFMFVIHGSAPELRQKNEKGIGIYYDQSPELRQICKKIDTPFGPILYLDGTDAKDFMKYFNYVKWYAAEKRKKAAEMLFGKIQVVSNPMHQGLINFGEILLGAQHISDDPKKLFPVALRSDLPMYLITALPNLTTKQIENLGFEHRAKKNGVYEQLTHFNVIPHGGGYYLPHVNRVTDVLEFDGTRYFVCEQENEEAIMIFSDVRETQFSYRGKKIVNKVEDLNLGKIELKLKPKFVLKI